MKRLCHLAVPLAALVFVTAPARADNFYTENEIPNAARGFLGGTTGGLAKAVQKVFSDLGEPYPRRGSRRGECGLSTLRKRTFLDPVLGVRRPSSIKGKIGKGDKPLQIAVAL